MYSPAEQEKIWDEMERRLEAVKFWKPSPPAKKQTPEMLDRYHYDVITENLLEQLGDYTYEVEAFRERLREVLKKKRETFNWLLEYYFNEDYIVAPERYKAHIPRKTHREIPFDVKKYRQCSVCGRIFYDLSRNGRTSVCHYSIYEQWDERSKSYKRRYDKKGNVMSVCQVIRDNATSRKSHNSLKYGTDFSGYCVDGSACSYNYSTRKRIEDRMFTWYPQAVDEDNEREKDTLRLIEAQTASVEGDFRDPQDIVCDTPTTHVVRTPSKTNFGWYPSKRRIKEVSDGKVNWVFSVDILTGEKRILDGDSREKFFPEAGKFLPIKSEKDLPIPKQT